MTLDPKEIIAIVESINKSVQVYSYGDISVEDLSNIIFNKLIASGISARIIGYTYNGNDLQSVQYYKQNKWANFDYSGLDILFQPIFNRTLDPQNIVKEEMVDVQYATPEYPEESSSDDADVTQDQVNTGVTNWISNHLTNFTSMVTTAVNNYLAAHASDFKGEDGAIGPQGPAGPGFPSGTYRIKKLIDKQIISTPTQLIEFTGLNGDLDEEYYLELNIQSNDGVRDSIYFNRNYSVPQRNVQHYAWQGGPGGGGVTETQLTNYEGNSNNWNVIKLNILPKTGRVKTIELNHSIFGISGTVPIVNRGIKQWLDSTTNLTSIQIKHDSDSGGIFGTFKLYKIVDMVIS